MRELFQEEAKKPRFWFAVVFLVVGVVFTIREFPAVEKALFDVKGFAGFVSDNNKK